MSEEVWGGGDLTLEVVRRWGYDENFILLHQDEVLVLYRFDFIPVLLELAADDRCPKQQYAYFILCQFCRGQVTRGGAAEADSLRRAWSAVPAPLEGLPLEWYRYAARLLDYVRGIGPVDDTTIRRMAHELLLGVAGRVGNIVEGESPRAGWRRFTLRTSLTEHLDICTETGAFEYALRY